MQESSLQERPSNIDRRFLKKGQQESISPILPLRFSPYSTTSPFSTASLNKDYSNIIRLKEGSHLDEALRVVDSVIQTHPCETRAYQLKGEIHYQRKEWQKSEQCYSRLLQLNQGISAFQLLTENTPPLVRNQKLDVDTQQLKALYLYNKGLCLQQMGKFKQSVESLQKSILLHKTKKEVYLSLAKSYRALEKFEKMYKIYDKLVDKSHGGKDQLIDQVLVISKQEGHKIQFEKYIEKGFQICKSSGQAANGGFMRKLLMQKGDLLRKREEYKQAIATYLSLSSLLPESEQSQVHSKMALCYDAENELDRALKCYEYVLQRGVMSLEGWCNISNLMIRKKQYDRAAQKLRTVIGSIEKPTQSECFLLILLKCHLMIALVKSERVQQAKNVLKDLISLTQENKILEIQSDKHWQNYKFIRFVIEKYQSGMKQLNQIQQKQDTVSEQVQQLQNQLMSSISQDLLYKNQSCNDSAVQKLSCRINSLYQQIMTFRNDTLKQYEQHRREFHQKLERMENMVHKKDGDRVKLEEEIESLKNEHQTLYNMLKQQTASNSTRCKYQHTISKLKENNETTKAVYLQNFYWVFNAYLTGIRLAANHLVEPAQHKLHLSKLSHILLKFKSALKLVSYVPHLGAVCDCISALLGLYLNQESHIISQSINQELTRRYSTERQLQVDLEEALLSLLDSGYIQSALSKVNLPQSDPKKLDPRAKAMSWFRNQKQKITHKFFSYETKEGSSEDRIIRDLVVEDVSAVFVFMVKSQSIDVAKDGNYLKSLFGSTLTEDYKGQEITSLFSRQTSQPQSDKLSCSRCQIYIIQVRQGQRYIPHQNEQLMWDDLAIEALREGNSQLLAHALSKMRLQFRFD